MSKFGYTIHESGVFDYDKNDFKISKYITDNEPTLSLCISCGSCSATCTGGMFNKLEPHMLHIYIKRDMKDKILPRLQNCMYCGKCQLICPRGVNNRNIIRLLWDGFNRNLF